MSTDTSGLQAQWALFSELVFEQAAEDLFQQTQQAAEHHRVTGAMSDSGSWQLLTSNSDGVSGFLEYTAETAGWTDQGTAPHGIDGNPFLSFTVGGSRVVVRHVDHPGYAGDSWYTDVVTDGNWDDAVSRAAASVSV